VIFGTCATPSGFMGGRFQPYAAKIIQLVLAEISTRQIVRRFLDAQIHGEDYFLQSSYVDTHMDGWSQRNL